jgi:hypothetical protein
MVFFHPMAGMQVASGRFSMAAGEAEITRLELEMNSCRNPINTNFKFNNLFHF